MRVFLYWLITIVGAVIAFILTVLVYLVWDIWVGFLKCIIAGQIGYWAESNRKRYVERHKINGDIIGILAPNHAGCFIDSNNKTVNYGVILMDLPNDSLTYWNLDKVCALHDNEKSIFKIINELSNMDKEYLIENGTVEIIPLSSIQRVLF